MRSWGRGSASNSRKRVRRRPHVELSQSPFRQSGFLSYHPSPLMKAPLNPAIRALLLLGAGPALLSVRSPAAESETITQYMRRNSAYLNLTLQPFKGALMNFNAETDGLVIHRAWPERDGHVAPQWLKLKRGGF